MMERGLRGKVAALGAAVVLCAGGSLLGSSPQDTAAVVPVPAAGISAVQTRVVKVYVSGAVARVYMKSPQGAELLRLSPLPEE